MTVQELINELMAIKDKSLEVVFHKNESWHNDFDSNYCYMPDEMLDFYTVNLETRREMKFTEGPRGGKAKYRMVDTPVVVLKDY